MPKIIENYQPLPGLDVYEVTHKLDPMTYLDTMDQIDPTIKISVINAYKEYDDTTYSAIDVETALNLAKEEKLNKKGFAALLSSAADPYLEEMAQIAHQLKTRHFGNSIYLFTPLYLSNYCNNYCVYCGFNCYNKIHRAKLNDEQMQREMEAIASTGLEEILLLTGESRTQSPVDYIGRACRLAKKYFKNIGVEIYPLNIDEYSYIHQCGADYVTVFQETYDAKRYSELHLWGTKRVFPYRIESQERALMGGMRGIAFAALLGLANFRNDAYATGIHAYLMQRKYPHAEISFSCPRLRPTTANDSLNSRDAHERQLLQIICAYRLFLPYAGITISTRERAKFRDNAVKIAATKISAGVSTGIGAHSNSQDQGDDQFEIADGRSVEEIRQALFANDLQPINNEYIYV